MNSRCTGETKLDNSNNYVRSPLIIIQGLTEKIKEGPVIERLKQQFS